MKQYAAKMAGKRVAPTTAPAKAIAIAVAIGIATAAALAGCAPKEAAPVEETAVVQATGLLADDIYAQLSNQTQAWGLKKQKGAEPEVPDAIKKTLAEFGGTYLARGKGKAIYLTFDEGYENGYTGPILDVLQKTNTPAAFFITGDYLEKEPELVRRMAEEGHVVGNHTVNHPSMPTVADNAKLAAEITKLADDYTALTGKTMKYIRPPKGEYSERTLAISKDLGYTTVLWSFAYADWETGKQKGADYAYNAVMPYLHDGAVLLLHAVSKDNAEALERIITDARAQGFEFRSLDEL